MFRNILLVLLMAFSFNAVAQNKTNPCDNIPLATKEMNAQEVNTLLEACRGKTASGVAAIADTVTPENASRFSEAAKGVAQAVGIAAKELGIAANDFLDSPAGYVLAAVLLFNYGGSLIAGILFGLPITFLALFLLYKFYRNYRAAECEYQYIPVLWGMFHRRRIVKYRMNEFDEGDCFYTLAIAGGTFIGLVILWGNLL